MKTNSKREPNPALRSAAQSRSWFMLAAALLALGLLMGACDDTTVAPLPPPLVVVGDSLSAGHQNGCTVGPWQDNGYAKVLANQMGLPLTLPYISAPGIRPCMDILETGNILSIARIADETNTANWGTRVDPTVQAANLATPGTRLVDAFSAPGDNTFHAVFGYDYAVMWDTFLNQPTNDPPQSMLDQAVAQIVSDDGTPDYVIMWLGANDALWAALAGTDALLTPPATFEALYDVALAQMNTTSAQIVVASIPDVTVIPHLMPVDEALLLFGTDVTTDGVALGVSTGDYVPMGCLGAIGAIVLGGGAGPLADTCVLVPAEMTAIQAAIDAYNTSIAALAAAATGVVHVDINAVLADAKLNGYVVGAETLTTDLCGGLFSLDGVHPTNAGYAIVANEFITVMNADLGESFPPVDVVAVRANETRQNRCEAAPL